MSDEELREMLTKPEKAEKLSLEEIGSLVLQICDYDDQTAKNLLLPLADIEIAAEDSKVLALSLIALISDATFMHTQARELAQRGFIENLRKERSIAVC